MRRPLEFAAAILLAAPFFINVDRPWPLAWPPSYPFVALVVAAPLAVLGFRRAFRGADSGSGNSLFGLREVVFLIGFPLFSLLVGNNRFLSSGDNAATREFGLLVSRGKLDYAVLPQYQEGNLPYAFTRAGGRVLPAFPLGTAVLALPHSLVAILAQGTRYAGLALMRNEKHCAALLMAAAGCLLFGGLRPVAGSRVAWITTAVFGVCTPVMTTTGQALWTSTGSVFFLVLALRSLLMREATAATAVGGAALAAAVLCRPTAALPAAFILIAVVLRSGRRALLAAAAGGAVFLGASLALMRLYGTFFGAYVTSNAAASNWRLSWDSVTGVLVSPSRGLLLYMPFVLFAGMARRSALRRADSTIVFVWVSVLAIAAETLLASCYRKWSGGHAIGPRLLSEASPFFALLLLPLWEERELPAWPRRLLLVAVSWAGAVQILGAYNPNAGAWNAFLDGHPEALWSWRNGQLAATLVPGWRPEASIPPEPPGSEDPRLTGSLEEPAEAALARGDLLVRGWAHLPDENLHVLILIDRKERSARSFRRVPRPDIGRVLPGIGDTSRAGYEAVFPFTPGDEGEHEIVVVFFTRDGRIRHYPIRRFVWRP